MRHSSAVLCLAVACLAVAGCSDNDNDNDNSNAPSGTTVLGSTPSWFDGDEVQLDYTRQFECKTPPSSGASTGCEMGDEAQTEPAKATAIPVLYVMVPLGFSPDRDTLHCPDTGNCVAHPATLDISRVFGAGTANAPLPPHSHIIIDTDSHLDGPWELETIGVKDLATWNQIAATKNLGQVRLLQFGDPGEVHVTGDIATNIFLFFKVH